MKVFVHKKGSITLLDVFQAVKENKDFSKAGAVAMFIGVVRGETETEKQRVEKLEIEAYEEKANEVLERICNDSIGEEGIIDVQIHHLLGEFEVSEELVYVLVAGSHRNKVFPALRNVVDRYKMEVPIFKKEYIINGKGKAKSYWVTEHKIHDKREH